MSIDLFELPSPCRSGQFCQLCRDSKNPTGATFRQSQLQMHPEMYGPAYICNFGLPWNHPGPAPWASDFSAMVRAQMRSAAEAEVAKQPSTGPGDVVKLVLARMGYQLHPNCGCEEFRQQMNAWGWRGCIRRRKQIIEWFTLKARERNIDVTDASIWSLVRGGLKDLLKRRV
ncbi:MAG: hypothetical protein H7Z14_03805 [Anaerolineae bacterium]|nr:hypothetical protein [Phycisphaerae bacterium]